MEPVNILDARNSLSKLVAAAESGDEVVIAKRGRPVVRLVPVEQNRLTGAVLAQQLVRNPPPSMRTSTEIDDDIRDARESWGQ
jgi:prevent-host-death family protein